MISDTLRLAFGDAAFTLPEAGYVLGIRNPSSAMNRLKEAGVVVRVGRGRYALRVPDLDGLPFPMEATAPEPAGDREPNLAALACARWADWLGTGRVVPVGQRRYQVNLPVQGRRWGIRVRSRSP